MERQSRSRAARLTLTTLGVLAAAWLLPPAVHRAMRLCPARPDGVREAKAYGAFARRYGVECSVCHVSPAQLTPAGYRFRIDGYRMPDEVGNDATPKNYADMISVRMREQYKVTSEATNSTGGLTPAGNGFSNPGLDVYPVNGAFGKYWAANTEVDFNAGTTNTTKGTAGSVSFNRAGMIATVGINQDSWATLRAGIISAFQGYGAADTGIGLLQPGWKPTPSQVAKGQAKSFTYPGLAPNGEGLELAYNWKDTHVSAQITNGYNSFNNSGTQGEDNYLKDFSFFVNQMINGDSAISALYYTGETTYGQSTSVTTNGIAGADGGTPGGNNWVNNYQEGAVYGTYKILPNDKMSILAGVNEMKNHMLQLASDNGADQFNSWGWFTTLQSKPMEHFVSALSYGTNKPSTRTGSNRSQDVTLSFAFPFDVAKFGLDFQTKRIQNSNSVRDTIANTMEAEWMLFF